ncbi:MAG: hypothetical protein H0V17_03895 [Deltaproteobacteria bacterium]|nr:hypothetical protein [Deltaproteobacteria bacterium]
MSARSDVLLWATRIVNKGAGAAPNQLLEIRDGAGLDEAQAAFHKVARVGHPDLHRASLSAEELELVTTAYSRVAGAYQEYRTQRMQTTKLPRMAIKPPTGAPVNNMPRTLPPPNVDASKAAPTSSAAAPTGAAAATTPKVAPSGASAAMTPKALIYYRKAEQSLRRGELKSAVLQLRMAIAADPLSTMLRQALTEVESEIAKG